VSDLKVFAVIASETVSGPGRQLTAIVPKLRDRNVDLQPVILQRSKGTPPLAQYMRDHGVESTLVRDNGPADPGVIRRLRFLVHARQPDLIQTHAYKATAAGYLLTRGRSSPPWIAFFHGSTNSGWKDRAYHRMERFLLRYADAIVGMSEVHRSELVVTNRRIHVIRNAVLPISAPAGPTAALVPTTGPRTLASIGRLSHEKGVDVLLRALGRLGRDHHDWRCLIAGEGPERPRLEELTMRLELGNRVTFLGQVDDVHELYAAADLIVLPSRSEGLPNVLLEALYASKSVIATAVGGVPEVVGAAGSSLLVPPDDSDALAERIGEWLRDELPDVAAIRSAVLDNYSLDRRADAHIDLYDTVLVAQGQRAAGVGNWNSVLRRHLRG
jgi:glycosyltransferase involved in cell wall biosynthesis